MEGNGDAAPVLRRIGVKSNPLFETIERILNAQRTPRQANHEKTLKTMY